MLKLINLWTLNQIFERAKTPLSGTCKMIYINCLMHYFDKLEASFENSVAFEIFDSELDYEKFEKHFVELHKAGFVIIKEKSIFFENHWGQFIDRSKLTLTGTEQKAHFHQNTIFSYEENLCNSEELRVHISRKYKLKEPQYKVLLNDFLEEQKGISRNYNDYKDVSSHFFYWCGKRTHNLPEKGKSSQILGM